MKLTKKLFAFLMLFSFWAVQNCAVVCAFESSKIVVQKQQDHSCCQEQTQKEPAEHQCNCEFLSHYPAFTTSIISLQPPVKTFLHLVFVPNTTLEFYPSLLGNAQAPPELAVNSLVVFDFYSRGPPHGLLS